MTLREKLIEAGADGLDARIGYDTIEVRNWGEEPMADAGRLLAARCLDAFLDCLAENADETVHVERKGWRSPHRLGDVYADDLLAVLRESDDE